MKSYIFYMIIYFYASYSTNLEYYSNNSIEFLFGAAISALIMKIIEIVILKIAYSYTGTLYSDGIISTSNEGKTVHWIIRAILMILTYFLSKTQIPAMIISPLAHSLAIIYEDQLSSINASFISIII